MSNSSNVSEGWDVQQARNLYNVQRWGAGYDIIDIKAAGELKTKPTQQSVAKLREIGITPHLIACRCEKPLDKELRQKISMFCNVPFEAVIEAKDVLFEIIDPGRDELSRVSSHAAWPPRSTARPGRTPHGGDGLLRSR